MNYNEVINSLNDTIKNLDYGKVFILRDLFLGNVWESFSKGDRITLGKTFKGKVLDKEIDCVQFIGKAPNNSAKYRKL